MLKPFEVLTVPGEYFPAAFGRLCVETRSSSAMLFSAIPAAFGRLCVETPNIPAPPTSEAPAAFGRLCVETAKKADFYHLIWPAAFGRLCVETVQVKNRQVSTVTQPPSGGCVLKQQRKPKNRMDVKTSRLRAAVC